MIQVEGHLRIQETPEELKALRTELLECKALPNEHRWRKISSLLQSLFSKENKVEVTLEGILDLLERDNSQLFDILLSCLRCSSTSNVVTVLGVLTDFIKGGHMTRMILNESTTAEQLLTPFQEHLIHLIVKLPDMVANRIHGLDPGYSPNVYTRKVMSSIVDVLTDVSSLKSRRSLSFIAQLIGRLSLRGQSASVVSCYVGGVEEGEAPWMNLSADVLNQLPDNAVDSVLTQFLFQLPPSLTQGSCLLWRILGPTALVKETFRYSLLHKNLLVRTHLSVYPLYNIAGYLLSSEEGCSVLVKTLQTLVSVWVDPSSLRHSPVTQHLYISQAVVLFTSCCVEKVPQFDGQSILPLLLNGVGEHLESTTDIIRAAGQVVAECVITRLDKHSSGNLKFEDIPCGDDERMKVLRSLGQPLHEQEQSLFKKKVASSADGGSLQKESLSLPSKVSSFIGPARVTDESDSDDEFVPYAMPDEVDTRGPHYLRQCIQDLVQTKDVEKFEAALKRVEGLVRRNPLELKEVCVELIKVLVHLGDEFAVEGFHDYRSTAMVAIATNCPDQVTQYLTSQVYSENYSLRHRMDMLEVLTLSATELSSVVPPVPAQVEKAEITETTRRMEGKTKRFPSAKRIDGQPNRLAPVAGYFFFPLVNGFNKAPAHVQKDTMFLTKLLFSLGLITSAASGVPIAERIAKNLLEFIAQFAKDHERSVKEGVLFCCHMAVSCLPALASHEGCAQLMEYINKTMSSEREELEGGLKTRLGISQ